MDITEGCFYEFMEYFVKKVEVDVSSKEKIDFDKDNVADEIDEDSNVVMTQFERDKKKRKIDQFKIQNEHINQINDSLMQANRMLKQDLQEVNKNYSQLVQVEEEEMKRRKMMQEHNIRLAKDKEELEKKLSQVQK